MLVPFLAAAILSQCGVSIAADVSLTSALAACSTISKRLSSASEVYYAASVNYITDNEHWMSSSEQTPACVVEVGSAADTAKVMKVIASTKTPFAIKSGGHSSNQNFSSTKGILIAMTRLNQVTLSSDKSRVTVGMGNVWTDVYDALDGTGRGVNGGRVAGPGTGGFTLGGGYSWTTNQYGLTSDSAMIYSVVLPNGTVTKAMPGSDLAFALKGGLNRFGVVTDVTYKTYAQGNVFGGLQIFGPNQLPALIRATNKFGVQNKDRKAQVILTLNSGSGPPEAILLTLYDGKKAAAEKALAPYAAIPALIDTRKEQSFASFVSGTPSQVQGGKRGAFHTLMTTKLTTPFMMAVLNETKYYGSQDALTNAGGIFSYDLEPFDPNYGQHAVDGAFPHSKSPLPLNLYWGWLSPTDDAMFRNEMVASVARLTKLAKAEGIFDESQPVYPNYALARYKGVQLYGANTARLRKIREEIDPEGIMELSGGFVI